VPQEVLLHKGDILDWNQFVIKLTVISNDTDSCMMVYSEI